MSVKRSKMQLIYVNAAGDNIICLVSVEPNPHKTFAHEIGKSGCVVKSTRQTNMPLPWAKYAHSSEPILHADMRNLVLGVGWTRGLCLD